MAKVVMIVPTGEMRRDALLLLPQAQVDAEVFAESSATVLSRVAQAKKDGALVAIARGNHASLILKHLDIPLVEIRLNGQSIAELIVQAVRLAGREHTTVAFLGFKNMFSDISAFEGILGVRTLEYLVDSSEEIPDTVRRAKADGADALVGGEIALGAAREIGLPGVFLRSNSDDLLSALRTAKRVLYAIELEKKNTVEVTTLLNYSFDGILKLDPEGLITKANYMAERVFRRGAGELIGQPITRFFDEQDGQAITGRLKSRDNQQSFMLRIGRVSLIANLANLAVDGGSEGAILSFQEFGAIEAMEEIIRQDRYSRVQKALRRFNDLKSRSPAYLAALQDAQKYAQFDLPILLYGEVGTGKRTLSECVHNASLRRSNPFITMDCAGMPAALQEELLSGSERNSALKSAHTGTLFIDNIDRLTPAAQYQLLCALRDGVVWQMDRLKALPVNVRVIAATSRSLYGLAVEGAFSLPLYSMLSQLEVSLPALRDRPEDIQDLTDLYVARYCTRYRKHVVLTPEARGAVAGYSWPGNLMQLNLYAEKLTLLAEEQVVNADFILRTLPGSFREAPAAPGPGVQNAPVVIYSSPEAETILRLLEKHQGSRMKAAQEMGVSKTTLWRKMKEYGIQNSFRM